jgi:hypothetical protein
MKLYGKKYTESPTLADLKGKYLFAKKGGGAFYKSGPPPLTPRQAMRRGVIKALVTSQADKIKMFRSMATQTQTQAPRPSVAVGEEGPPGLLSPTDTSSSGGSIRPFEEPGERVRYPDVGPPPGLEDVEPGQYAPGGINWRSLANAARTTIGSAISAGSATTRAVDRALFGWADSVSPMVGTLIRGSSIIASRDVVLHALFGDYAEPIISGARASDRYAFDVTNALTDYLLRPGVGAIRNVALSGTAVQNALNAASAAGAIAYSAGEGVVAAGASSAQDVVVRAIAANAATVTDWIPTATENLGNVAVGVAGAGGGSMRNLFFNLLQMAGGILPARMAMENAARRIERIAPGAVLLYNFRNVPGRQAGFYRGMQ